MKKVFLFLAAAVAFASCVKEAAPVLDQDNDNLVTITALATKTTLDGVSVVWEENDDIAVVYGGMDLDAIPVFSTTESGSAVKFTGTHPDGYQGAASAYTVYPSDAVTLDAGVVKISHTIPAEQDGVVDPGLNLSFTELDVEALKAGNVSATFHNALTLLKVIVPEGVKEVSFTSNDETLVGEAEFYAPAGGKLGRKSGNNGGKTVTLTRGGSDLEGTHYLLVYPAYTDGLDLRMVGLDDTVYENSVPDIKFLPSEYRTINLTKVFKMDVNATEAVSPLGGELVIPVAATEQYTYTVEIADDPSWISFETSTYVQTKGVFGTNIVFNVAANTTGATRSANVTITWNDGEEQNKKFKITQESAYLDFVYVDPADPASGLIQWEETFDIFGDNSLNNKLTASPYTGVFTIEINEENPEKGTYIVKNIFKNSQFTSGGSNHDNKGGEYYANYGDGKLTILNSNANISSYVFANDVVLTYDPSLKKFTSGAIKLGFTPGGPYNQNNKFIGNYEAVHYVAPDPGAGSVNPLAAAVIGTYTESGWSGWPAPGTLVISATDDPSKGDLRVKFGFDSTLFYATVGGDASSTTLTIAETETMMWGKVSASLTFIPSASYFYGSVNIEYGSPIYSYSASL